MVSYFLRLNRREGEWPGIRHRNDLEADRSHRVWDGGCLNTDAGEMQAGDARGEAPPLRSYFHLIQSLTFGGAKLSWREAE
jgi:hypothetical protein